MAGGDLRFVAAFFVTNMRLTPLRGHEAEVGRGNDAPRLPLALRTRRREIPVFHAAPQGERPAGGTIIIVERHCCLI
jgi:hypothetical protein